MKSGARLEGVYAGKGGRVIVRGANEAEVAKLRGSLVGYTMQSPEVSRLRVVVYDVPTEIASKEDDFFEQLRVRNFPDKVSRKLRRR